METKYYYYFDRDNSEIVKATAEEIIRDFAEETTTPCGIGKVYFYDKEDCAIYRWCRNGKRSLSVGEVSAKEAEEIMVEWAVETARADGDGQTYIYESLEEVLNDIENQLNDDGAWDLGDDWDIEIRSRLIAVLDRHGRCYSKLGWSR